MFQREKSSLQSEFETKLESQAQRYEERITELHAVIFDINKRYDQLHGDTIRYDKRTSTCLKLGLIC